MNSFIIMYMYPFIPDNHYINDQFIYLFLAFICHIIL